MLNRPSHEAKVEDGTFEEHEVYAIDIVVSTGAARGTLTVKQLRRGARMDAALLRQGARYLLMHGCCIFRGASCTLRTTSSAGRFACRMAASSHQHDTNAAVRPPIITIWNVRKA